ncbi:MAG: cytosine permease [Candidatus Bathyarchaeia archaeon]|nr:cytosine permease [Candidatus Bathyarchaeia archaeon]
MKESKRKFGFKLPPEWGADPVPAEKKILGLFDYFILWSSLAVGLLVLQAGGLLVPSLSLVEAVIVAVWGSVVGSLMLALAGGLGSKYGIPTMVSLRAVLGLKGSFVPTILNVIQLIGWASFEIIIMANSAISITGSFLGPYTLHFWIIVFAVWCFLLCVGGPLVVVRHWLEKFAIWFTYGTAIYITYIVLSKFPQLLVSAGDGSLSIPLALDLVIAMPISWWPLISDYNRFSKSEKDAFLGTLSGYTFANSWFYALGALLVLAYHGESIIYSITSITFGGLALTLLLVDETDNCFADIYSGAVSIQNISPKTKQLKIVAAITVVSVLLAALMPTEWQSAYEGFLLYIGAVFVPLLGVLAVDFYLVRKRAYSLEEFYSTAKGLRVKPIISWIVGVIVYFIFYNYTTWGSSIPSFIISAVMLYVLEKGI